ncbi:DUF6777 domain-containing protein [Streptomyces sp. NPDC052101]|uniref:DUF6777 domain-containing protein n=1 Tax=Streptomyces sp. NPDC052101 TaxID=3155763 RepID=UPI00342E9D18
MRIPTGSIALVCALSVALLVAGCARPGVKEARMGEEVYLLPATAQGPDPFTGSMVTATTATTARTAPGTGSADPTAPPRTGTADPAARVTPGAGATGPPIAASSRPALPAALVVAPLRTMRVLSGATPGLYSGTARVAGCDVERQIGRLTADRGRAAAFARAAGVPGSGLPGYLHGLTPVALRADTRVTGHGYRGGEAVGYQAVLQAGTAVLVDNRGVPRVRCACGNPLASPEPTSGGFGARGSAWSGYRPGQVIAVTPAPRAVTSITIVNVETRTWIERRIGHDVRDDQVVPAPAWVTTAPDDAPVPRDSASAGTATPTAPGRPAGPSPPAPAATAPWPSPSLDLTRDTPDPPDTPYGIGPPDTPDLPDIGGLIPDGIPYAR